MKLKRIKPLVLRTPREDETIEEIENDNINNDWDFSFDEYEKEEQIIDDSITSITDKKPKTSNLISKYHASTETIQLLVNIRTTLSDKAIAVASRSGDIKDIKDLYGCLNEAWAIIKDIYGSAILNEINNLDKNVLNQILFSQKQSKVSETLYDSILNYRDKIYMLIQRVKLGIEVERKQGSTFGKAKTGIIE